VSRRVLARGLSAAEGPVVGPNGWVLNVNSFDRPEVGHATRGGDITATHPARPGETRILFNTGGIPAALAFGPDGCLYVTDSGRRSIVRVEPDLTQTDLVRDWQGQPFNGTNDLSFDADGNLYFTDPYTTGPDNPVGGVYCYLWATRQVRRIDHSMQFPNGIVVRGDRLYVAETCTRTVWLHDVFAPGETRDRRVHATLPPAEWEGIHGPDGMCFDAEGNLYVAYFGGACVCVFDDSGALVERLDPGSACPTNVCFGGERHDELFVTLDDTGELMVLEPGAHGERLAFCPSLAPDHSWGNVLPPH
jgi:gluconolactonase